MAKATNFLIVHGAFGNPEENWFPWLKNELEANGHQVAVPSFPTPENHSFETWRLVAQNTLKSFDISQTVLIGHSTGAAFVLRLAELAHLPFKAIFPICPFIKDLGLEPFDGLNASFVHHDFNWTCIKEKSGPISCFAGDNDPYVPLAYAKEVADLADGPLTVVKNGGHLNAAAGFSKFPLLLSKIRQTVSH